MRTVPMLLPVALGTGRAEEEEDGCVYTRAAIAEQERGRLSWPRSRVTPYRRPN